MNELRLTGKKALSLLMAVMMILTAWVWVEPTKAQAATAGKYYVRFSYSVDNKDDDKGGEYTGTVADNKNGMLITYTRQNGTIGTYIVSLSGGTSVTGQKTCNTHVQSEGNKTCTAQMDGLPTSILLNIYGSSTDITEWYLTKVEVSSSSNFSSNLLTLWEGKVGSHVQTWMGGTARITIDIKGNSVSQADNTGTNTKDNTTNNFKGVPTANKITYTSVDATSITIPKNGEADVTKTYAAGVYDQYGVRMSYEPKYYVRNSNVTSAQSSSSNITGVTMTSGTSNGTLKVTSNAQLTDSNSKTVYVHAVYGSVYANRSVTLNDPTYTFNYDKNTTDSSATVAPSSSTTGKYYDQFGSATISGTRTGYTFEGFYQSKFDDSLKIRIIPAQSFLQQLAIQMMSHGMLPGRQISIR